MTPERILLALGLGLGLALSHAPRLSADPQRAEASRSAPETAWARIRHPMLSVTLDMPVDASYQQVRSFPLGSPRSRTGRRREFTLFGVRSLDAAGLRYHALEVALFAIGPETRGIEAPELARLPSRIRDAGATQSIVLDLLYTPPRHARLRDLGLEFIDGLPGRRFAVDRLMARGTRDERRIEGEILLLPLDRTSAMLVVARFDAKSTPEERKVLFLRILRSIRLEDRPGGALDAAVPRWLPLGS